MIEQYYRLTGRPFQLTPDPAYYFNSMVHRKAVSYLLYGLGQGEGFIVLTGEVGAGKTTLLRHVLSRIDQTHYVAAQIETSQLGADDMLRMVGQAFGLAPTADKASLLATIKRFLTSNQKEGRQCLLLIDEAQNLSIPALEELRMLSNFQIGEKSLMQSFLIAQPQFRATLASEGLEQLRQRVIASFHLGPMSEGETSAYIDHRLRTAGWEEDPSFAIDCAARFFHHTGGMPRRINSLMSRLLLYGCLEELHHFTGQMVDAVAMDLRQEIGGPGLGASPLPTATADDVAQRLRLLDARSGRQGAALSRTLSLFAEIVAP